MGLAGLGGEWAAPQATSAPLANAGVPQQQQHQQQPVSEGKMSLSGKEHSPGGGGKTRSATPAGGGWCCRARCAARVATDASRQPMPPPAPTPTAHGSSCASTVNWEASLASSCSSVPSLEAGEASRSSVYCICPRASGTGSPAGEVGGRATRLRFSSRGRRADVMVGEARQASSSSRSISGPAQPLPTPMLLRGRSGACQCGGGAWVCRRGGGSSVTQGLGRAAVDPGEQGGAHAGVGGIMMSLSGGSSRWVGAGAMHSHLSGAPPSGTRQQQCPSGGSGAAPWRCDSALEATGGQARLTCNTPTLRSPHNTNTGTHTRAGHSHAPAGATHTTAPPPSTDTDTHCPGGTAWTRSAGKDGMYMGKQCAHAHALKHGYVHALAHLHARTHARTHTHIHTHTHTHTHTPKIFLKIISLVPRLVTT
ncbi:hypothetical protein E2C01_046448 [Portunus trituberculatus]|uniref:Uncharacterized protein n=1 Tax=Portunus trituberculatus TaxID=210409 RepID=A0A5B7G615_PORTR|nr:hypothetical protein [Portunus trituberculatus]